MSARGRGSGRRLRAAAAACALAGLALAIPATSSTASQDSESWYDADHGWRVGEGLVAQETNDGGRTWRTLPNPHDSQVASVLRTGLTAGVYENSIDGSMFWTNDGGKHWSQSLRIGSPAIGSGSFLFWWHGRSVYRVRPWPAPYRCTTYVKGMRCGYKDGRGRLREAAFTATKVASVPAGTARASVVPGGVVAVTAGLARGERPSVALVRWVRRDGRPTATTQELPLPADRTFSACEVPLVRWPILVVTACEVPSGTPSAFWRSRNGGRDWQFSGLGG